jgi:protein-disulfide isomerase
MRAITFNHVIAGILGLTLLMQAAILYRGYQEGRPPERPAVLLDAPKGSDFLLSGHPVRGDNNAKIVIVEFSDYECPFCQRHFDEVGKQIEEKYIVTGKLRHVFINNPLPIHPEARLLATAALCAQDHYWEMHDVIFAEKLKSKDALGATASKLGIDALQFEKCLTEPSIVAHVEKDQKIAEGLNLRQTPAFGLGRLDQTGRIHLQRLIIGAQSMPIFDKEIAQAISN